MTRTQRRIVRPLALSVAGTGMTVGLILALLPLMYGLDSAIYLAVITVALLLTYAGIQLATPKRRKTA